MAHPYLSAIRTAFLERVDAAYVRNLAARDAEPAGLPYSLISAGCWLVANGYEGDVSPAEKAMGWGPNRYRQYLDTLDSDARAVELEDGRKRLFEGRRPIFIREMLQVAA